MLPHVAARVLALPLEGSESSEGIAQLIASDACLTAEILRAANSTQLGSKTPVTRIAEAVERLGPGLVHSTVLSIALSTVTNAATGSPPSQKSFWMHCLACGACSELVAERIGSVYTANAFVAGLLHDIGKIVLELVAPEAYARARDAAQRHDLFILEAEQRELGIDHTLIGKWLAESWELPTLFTDVIWLHHQAPGTLDATQYPVELIEIVNLANALAHESMRMGARMGRRESITDEQLQRLGLRREDLQDLRAQAPVVIRTRMNALQAEFDEDLSADALQRATRELLAAGARFDLQAKSLRREIHRLRALRDLNSKLRSGQSLREVLDVVVDAARQGLELGAGACFVADAKERFLLGKWWKRREERPKELRVDLEKSSTTALATLEPRYTRKLEGLTFGRDRQGWVGASLMRNEQREGLLVVPMRGEGRTVGHLVLDVETGEASLSSEELEDVAAFAEACGKAVARQRAEEDLLERTEDLAAALWKKEIQYKKVLQAERLNSEANVAAGAAHALSKHLAEITIQAQLLNYRRRGDEDSESIGAIVQQSRRAHKVIEDLIAFARTPLPKLEPTLIHFVLHQAVSQWRERLATPGITVIENYAEGLPRVMVDRHQIVQAVTELLKNAEDAMAERGGAITVETSTSSDRCYVSIMVSDTGPGIPSQHRDRIYEPFFTTWEAKGRLGLGLPLCHRIVEKHRGTIDLETAPGEGTRFIITLPSTVHLSSQRSTPPATTSDEAIDAPTILVVDDEEQLCRVLKEHLNNRGYRVETAGDGLEALHTIAGHAIDLVLLDMCMPTRDGLSVLQELHERFSSVPVIVMTGLAPQEEVEDALRLGARSCLSKPFEIDHLLSEIEMVLSSPRK